MKKFTFFGALFLIASIAFVVGRFSGGPSQSAEAGKKHILYYVDPMHPAYHSDKPGIAPDCGMPLEPVYEGAEASTKAQLPAGVVELSVDRQKMIGVRVETVKKNNGSQLYRTTGRVELDASRVHRVMAGVEGWVVTVENTPPGSRVKKDELLASLYSKEFRNAQQAYLGSLTSLERLRNPRDQEEATKTNDANLRINEEQLRSLGMGELQIKELAKTRQVTRDITLTSPIDGIVLARDVAPGMRFDKGSEFYRIGDLSKVWIVADVFGNEGQVSQPGAKVQVTARELGKNITATVSDNPPLFDPATRTLKLRLEADNPKLVLRPDMFVDLEFNLHAPAGISVPQEAVLDSGMQKIVYVETEDGVFQPRKVEVGNAYGNRITVTSGLTEGDRIVTSGNFLIDSESRMRATPVVSSTTPGGMAQKTSNDAGKTNDPVCGMALDRNTARSKGHVEKFKGESYVFCSEQCQAKFHSDPAKYTNQKAANNAIPQIRVEERR
jgi:membrane fusion protein, copper/silver efflux system